MKIYTNDKLVKRNNKIGQIASIVSLVVLGVGMFYSFKDTAGNYISLTFGALIIGFLLFQFGNYYLSRWGKYPRPDQLLALSLKGLDDKYSLYNYMSNIFHLLVGPAGCFILLPYNQQGSISYNPEKGRWFQKGGNAFMKFFANEGIGRPDLEVKYNQADLTTFLQKMDIDPAPASDNVILVFTNPKADLDLENSPVAAVTGEKLKDYLRKRAKEKPVSPEWLEGLQQKITPTKES